MTPDPDLPIHYTTFIGLRIMMTIKGIQMSIPIAKSRRKLAKNLRFGGKLDRNVKFYFRDPQKAHARVDLLRQRMEWITKLSSMCNCSLQNAAKIHRQQLLQAVVDNLKGRFPDDDLVQMLQPLESTNWPEEEDHTVTRNGKASQAPESSSGQSRGGISYGRGLPQLMIVH